MAKVKPGKAGSKQSITRHPLFPATVALWFGALFGVGSLAIRPSLIEGLIVSLGIDTIISSAAPPLGATTRILLALSLAALGGSLGAWLARRIGRPKPVAVQRKRGAATADAQAPENARAAGSRRGRLALADEGKPRQDYLDHAPVPGHTNILDVSQFDLEGFEADTPETIEPAPEPAYAPEPAAEAEAVHWTPEPEARHIPQGAQVFQPVAGAQLPVQEPAASREPVQAFVREEMHDVAPSDGNVDEISDLDQPEHAPFAPPAEHAAFAQPQEPAAIDHAPFSAPELEPAASHEAAEEAPLARLAGEPDDPYQPLPPKIRPGSIFDQKPASGLFTQPQSTQVSHFGWDKSASRDQVAEAQEPVPSEQTATPAPPAEGAPAEVEPAASERIAAAPLGDLSHVELLERLALSMQRKRAAPATPEASAESSFAAPGEIEPVNSAADSAQVAFEAPPQPPVPVVPDALRPIGLDDDEDGDYLPMFVPPRHFGQQQDRNGAARAEIPAAAEMDEPRTEQLPVEPQAPATPVASETDELEQGYSSLLSLSRPGSVPQRFVRIEEPASPSAEVEPVVVFPGKEPVSGDNAFARPSGSFGNPASDQSANGAVRDPEETDRALRTALANIQRMSGAA